MLKLCRFSLLFAALFVTTVCQNFEDNGEGVDTDPENGEYEDNEEDQATKDINIGGLFEQLDGEGAKAFERAIDYVNELKLIPKKKLLPVVNEVSDFNSFEVGKTVCSVLKSGVGGIFGPQSSVTAHHVQSLCDTLEVPHVITRWDIEQSRSSCLINLHPHPSSLSKALRDIVEAWDWKGFTVIYDDYDALRKIHGILKLADDKGYLVTVRQLDAEDGNFRPLLKEIKHSEEKNIVVECSVDILPEVLTQAQQVGVMGIGYNYIISTLDFHTIDFEPFMWSETNITSIRLVNPEDDYVKEIMTRWAQAENATESSTENPIDENPNGMGEEGEEEGKRRRKRWTDSWTKFKKLMENENEILGENGGGDEGEEGGEGEGEGTEGTTTEMSTTESPSTEEEAPEDLPVPTVEGALMHDAVMLYAQALKYLDTISPEPIDCENGTSFHFGYSIINFMKLSEIKGLTGIIKFDHEGFRTDVELEVIELTEEGIKRRGAWNQTLQMDPPEGEEASPDPGEDLRNTTFTVLIALAPLVWVASTFDLTMSSSGHVQSGTPVRTIVLLYVETDLPPTPTEPVKTDYQQTPPYNMLKEDSKALKGNDRYEGFGVDLIQELSMLNGFKYIFKEQPDKSSGNPTELPNGTRVWSGMIGEVQAGRADLAISDITITRERERDADFTHPFMNLGISILHRKPTKAPPELFSFLSPFSPEVWAYMMSAYVGVSLLFFVMARISPGEWTNPYPCIEEPENLENQFSMINSFWFTVGSLMQQGSDIAPIGISTRMAASIWWFFTLIMVSSYTANLAAFLTVENPEIMFTDIEGLVKLKDMKWGAKSGGATFNFFRDSKDPIYQKVYEFMKNNPDCMMKTNEAGVARVAEDKNYAFFMESTSIEYEVERNCILTQVGDLLDSKGYGVVMRQNSSYRHVLSRNVVQLQEKGKLTQLKNKWWKEKRGGGACDSDGGEAAAGELTFANVGGVYVVLCGGLGFSIVVVICELLWDIYWRDDKESFKEELKKELKFILRCRGTVKPLQNEEESASAASSASGSSHSSKSSKSSTKKSKGSKYSSRSSKNSIPYK